MCVREAAILSVPHPVEAAPSDAGVLTYLRLEVPLELRDAVLRHHHHLVQLSSALRDAGLPEAIVAARIETAVASYREALQSSIQSLRQSR